ncbi:SLC13 family permease [Shewanella sp. SR44-3]|uniref:SLC13 family permease n=1 Tax=unclassified Shewanella TaxID=196818 RepID=UPI0015FBE447|nr:SLC13 family permease [Shewanella sp. SR44-3]MBB1270731.1 SLC13 family permease [Shewanella sp. SR44-3]
MLAQLLPLGWELGFVFAVLAIAIVLFVTDVLKMDLVALLVVLALALSGIISPKEAVSGFGAAIVITIAALFVVGEGLYRSGVAASVGNWILTVGGSDERRLTLLLMPAVALLSGFMSSTGAVALFIPVVLCIARKASMSVPRLMMPLAFASLIGGMMTLIGTPPNIVASGSLVRAGHNAFGFFDFTPIGLVILLVAMLYLPFAVRYFIPVGEKRDPKQPHPRLNEFTAKYNIADKLHRLQISQHSPLVGQTVADTSLRSHYDVTVFGIQRKGQLLTSYMPVLVETQFNRGDILLIYGSAENLEALCTDLALLTSQFSNRELTQMQNEFGLSEVMLRPSSSLIGQTIKSAGFREKFNLSVVGVRRGQDAIVSNFNELQLTQGDTLLLAGGWRYLQRLATIRDFVVLETPAEMEEVPSNSQKAPMALLIVVLMVVMMLFGGDSLNASLLAALLMIMTGCVRLSEAYQALNARSLVLIAGMLPLAGAMEKTGAVDLICNYLVTALGGSSAMVICASFFILTSLLSQVMSNTATTVLIAPIAITTAAALGINPAPIMMSLAIGASTAFATPIASPVNTLVVAPGNYKFMDFVKVGAPLQLAALLVTILLVPWLFPF